MASAVQNGPPAKFRLSRSHRITKNSEIRAVYAEGRRRVGRFMVLWMGGGKKNTSLRLAVVSSRKVGNAVARNRARRRLREAFRLNRHRMDGNFDVVLVARHSINSCRFEQIEAELLNLARKAGLMKKESL